MTAATACVPVSWLRLERYALGELAADERAAIAGHLATCASCRACADHIAGDAQRELPPLPAAAPALPAAPPRHGWWRRWLAGRRAAAFAGFATVAAVFALIVVRPREQAKVDGPRVVAVKGGDVAVELVRERDGSTAWEPTSFAPGDHFKLLVTCTPPLRLHADVVVLQDDGAAFPGAPALIACGNRVPLPPAFRITGPGAATVCVGLDASAPPSRAALARGTGAQPGGRACLHLARAE